MVEIVSLDGSRIDIAAAEIGALRGSVRGGVVLAADAHYESARRVWNGNIDRRPALIARCNDNGNGLLQQNRHSSDVGRRRSRRRFF